MPPKPVKQPGVFSPEERLEHARLRVEEAALACERQPQDTILRAALFGRCRELRAARLAVATHTSSGQKVRRKR